MACDKCGDAIAIDTPIGHFCGDCFHEALESLPRDLGQAVVTAVSLFVHVSKEVEKYTLGLPYDADSIQLVVLTDG
ncbi:hypothetical protein [Zhongshania sp. BJYM1]|uniref:hypothetical protein n=1 Tax=Zhongshania aquatica TaxID=2965069 RepID=UPI0022B534AE|nr:hypothetical protein [Marortus sp. BJYM1]